MANALHSLLQLSGSIESGGEQVEIWSMGIRLLTTDPGTDDNQQASLLENVEYGNHFINNSLPLLNNVGELMVAGGTVKLKTIKVNSIGPDGKYADDQTVVEDVNVPVGGANITAPYPPQISKVITLETGRNRGLGHRGRVYVPGPSNAQTAPGIFTVTDLEIDTWKAFFNSLFYTTVLNTVEFTPAVVSLAPTATPQDAYPITAISIDSRFDVQRRRANDIAGARKTVQL